MRFSLPLIVIVLLASSPLSRAAAPQLLETCDISPVWAGHPVGFSLLTDAPRGIQYVAFYDDQRRMTVGSRKLGAKIWTFKKLTEMEGVIGKRDPGQLGWDSHNSVTMALDSAGQLHVSGNMHCNPLVYFRTATAGDVTSLKWIGRMVGEREVSCTYPRFINGPEGSLIFAYRDGRSGNGVDIYNRYDPASASWKRLIDTPLLDGQGTCNAYSIGPIKGPAGYFHLTWVWRNTPDCSTNHDVSYARSRDLIHWETSDGKPLALPITPATAEVVDPIPVKGGIVNGNTKIGFDADGKVIISYHKYDSAGKTQIYNARREPAGWKAAQATQWDWRWEFSGGGSIEFGVSVAPARVVDGKLVQTWTSKQYGSQGAILDPKTLFPTGDYRAEQRTPREIGKLESTFDGMQMRHAEDLGSAGEKGVRYMMKWETLGPNRDRPRTGELPGASMLRVYKVGGE